MAGRPKGAKNKETFIMVPVSALEERFKGSMLIPVKSDFANMMLGITEDDSNRVEEDDEDETPIPLKITRFD